MNRVVYSSLLLLILMTCHIYAIDLRIDTGKIRCTVNPKFINVAIFSNVVKNRWGKIKPHFERVKTLAAGLAPSYLRLGSFASDQLIFQNDKLSDSGSKVDAGKLNTSIRRTYDTSKVHTNIQEYGIKREVNRKVRNDVNPLDNVNMTASFYDEMHKFVSDVGWDLIFDLNLLLRKPDGDWDPSNAKALIKYTVQSGYKMGGWELGNEPNDLLNKVGYQVDAVQLVKDFHTLHNLLEEYSQFNNTELLGPSVTQLSTDDYFQRFMNAGGGEFVTAATFHQYYEGGTIAKLEDFYNPKVLNILHGQIQKGVNLTRSARTKAKLWLGETGSAWDSGAPGISNRYVAAFMWLDKLGMSARDGIDALIRQSFYGGHYSLIDHETCTPNPDYWLTLLFKLLVGNKVLRVTSPDTSGKIRAYAHCTQTIKSGYPDGSVTVYVMNLNMFPVNIELPDFPTNTRLHVYNMLPAHNHLLSKFVKLNGEKLIMKDDKTLPTLLRPVKMTSSVLIPALSYSFIVVPDARLHACI